MTTPIYIIGAGGFAREVAFLLSEITRQKQESYALKGFTSEQKGELSFDGKVFPILTHQELLSSLDESNRVAVALGIGTPKVSFRVLAQYLSHPSAKELSFPNLIHPGFVGSRASIEWGKGNIVTAGVIFTLDIKVGSFNIFNLSTTVGHDVKIGSYNVLNPGCNISGSVKIEDRILIGTNATVLQGLQLESDIIVGAGAVVTKNLARNFVYVGNPAKPLRPL